MRSGTSYFNLTVFRKHLTRFWPIWTAWLVVLLLMLPVRGLMALRRGAQMAGDQLEQFAINTVSDLMTSNLMLALAVLVGLLAAMAACSHLYSTRSANFMGALPVRREGLFLSHYLAGLVMVLGPVLAASLLTLLVELAGDALELLPLGYWLGYACAAGFFFYSFAVFLGMFTGHLLALPAFYLIFNFLVMAVVGMVQWVLQSFYYGFGGLPEWVSPVVIWCTPVLGFGNFWLGSDAMIPERGDVLWVYPLVALVLTVGALLLYRRRSLEAAGDVVTVPVMRPVFQYGVALCAGLFLGMVTVQMLGLAEPGLMVSILLWGIAGYFIAQMLLDKSFRVWRRWKGAAGVAAVFAALFVVVGFDLTGYETRVPRVEDVASVAVSGLDGDPRDSGSYMLATVEDPEEIAAAIALHQAMVDRRGQERAEGYDSRAVSYRVSYQMKDGSVLSRAYQGILLDEGLMPVVEALRNDPDVVYQSYGFDQVEDGQGVLISTIWMDGPDAGGELHGQQAQRLLEAVLKDVAAGRLRHTPGEQYVYEPGTYRSVQFEWRMAVAPGELQGYQYMEIVITDDATCTLAVMAELTAETEE